jgi:hypothetical protein
MRTVKVTVDERQYETFKESWREDTEAEIIERLKFAVDLHNKPRPPELRIVGKEKTEYKPETQNIVSLGVRPRMTEVVLNIKDGLYRSLGKIAKETGSTAESFIEKQVRGYTESLDESLRPNPTAEILMEALFGYNLEPRIRLVK